MRGFINILSLLRYAHPLKGEVRNIFRKITNVCWSLLIDVRTLIVFID